MKAYFRPRVQEVEEDPVLRAIFPVLSRERDEEIIRLTAELLIDDENDGGDDKNQDEGEDDDDGLLAC